MEVEEIKNSIVVLLQEFNNSKEVVRDCCSKYMDLHEHTETLDSLLFQSRLIDMDYNEISKLQR